MILWNEHYRHEADVHVSIRDRGYYFGDGVYEVFRIYSGILFEKGAHLSRLMRSAEHIRLKLPCAIAELERRLERLVALCGVTDGTLYVQITRGEAARSHPFPEAAPVLMAYCSDTASNVVRSVNRGVSAVTVADIRWHRCDIKSLNLLPNVLAKQEALDRGADEAILHRDGVVTECSAANVMVVRDGIIYTHPANHHILHGVTRAVALQLARESVIRVEERAATLTELAEADEAFMTGTTVEITPITTIDGRPVGDGTEGPVTAALRRAFNDYAGLSV